MSERRARLRPEAEATQFVLSGGDKPCLKVQWINDYKGRGVFACAPIEKGSFVVEYRGELISPCERDKRQKKYTEKQNAFLFDFKWNNSSWCIDASREDDSLGRLVNDGHKSSNCKVKKMTVQGKPHLCLFAIEEIQAESEITYDYGKSQWPWRALTPSVQILTQSSVDEEVSERSTSSFQQTPSVQILTQSSVDEEVSERSTSSFQQVSQTTGGVSFQQTATAKQLRACRRLQNLKRHHARCEERYDEAKKKIFERERQMTLTLFTRMNNSVSMQIKVNTNIWSYAN
ncbi:N-lysine methyltransferase KMT5A-like isoform X2 [Centropristis striata]|uniref:N-lysine methyltransferase KMT5A-like isoform X2 n=1 Tax=Centropristis striata TaxID=184440 RepID=UPI0027E015B5|nr:N-lysine methyltransferase KMT5A-like isoform X2 [Centropristis striata]